jgi:hypothetical protein
VKEDILEQLVDDYLKFNGFFTSHNVKFKPAAIHPDYSKQNDSVASDVDVIGFHPMREGTERVWVVGCKSWQIGFDPRDRIAAIEGNKIREGRDAWRGFRELVKPKWADALINEIERLTGSSAFTYVTAVTKLIGDPSVWENYQPFKDNLRGNPIKILTLQNMLTNLYAKTKMTVASSEVGRLLQVIKASGWKPEPDTALKVSPKSKSPISPA